MFPERIETDRLRLDRHDAAVDALSMYDGAGRRSETIAEETEFLTWSPHDHPNESHDVNERFRESGEAREAATYAVGARGRTRCGRVRRQHRAPRRLGQADGGVRHLAPQTVLGAGYSGERAVALASLAFDRLDLDLLSVDVVPDNGKSVRAIERYVDRLGGRREGRLRNWVVPAGEDPVDVVRYSVSRAEYERADVGSAATFVEELPTDAQ